MKARPEDLADVAAANARFRAEAAEFGLRYRCAACVHADPAGPPGAWPCSLGYPNRMLLGPVEAIGERGDARDRGHITFCKYFELGETELSEG